MELFRGVRMSSGSSILGKKISRMRRKISYTNISSIQKIGIVWDATRAGDFVSLSRFYQKMQDRNVDVKIIGYYPGKELPDQYTAIRFLSIIRRNELNFFYLPVSTEADVFIKSRFDVLIDINFSREFTLHYITALSVASFKVGLFNSEADSAIFDLMMEIKKPVQVESYLDQVIHYLEMINSGTTLKAVNQ
jgi:hypothetical protein